MDLIPRNFYLDDFFDDFIVSKGKNDIKCDIYEKDNKYYVEMDLPGFSKNDIKISINNKNLVISAEKELSTDDSKNYIRKERSYSKYSRTFYVGNVEENDIEASFEDGILTIIVPKEEEKESKKYIDIK